MTKIGVVEAIKRYVRAANYISAVQIYLQDNFLLQDKLLFNHIKPRLLGHWGTCPGINFLYANLNYLIKKYKAQMIFVLGPGHGFPALQSNLFIEGTLRKYYPETKTNLDGLKYLAKNFSWPYGFPSHSNPGAPGVILEGGELGYSLSTAYGAVLDNPNLIAVCMVGDGEAETGPTATAWHINKFIDPATNGAVLPVLHLNGYKISGPTIFGRMNNKELKALFSGYGYDPIIVEGDDVYWDMYDALEYAYHSIRRIQNESRNGKIVSPKFPMIILKTPKGWTGIKNLHGEKIEGNCLSHQVVGKNSRDDPEELKALEEWLRSYKFNELFDGKKGFIEEIKNLIPSSDLCMGNNKYSKGWEVYKELKLPDVKKFSEDVVKPGFIGSSSMRRTGAYLNEVIKLNKNNRNFRLMSPDETYSNKLDDVFRSTTRSFVWPLEKWDRDISRDGRVIEMLSEHTLQGLAQGYILTGRHAVFASYEAFIEIVSSMADQYEKFLKGSKETKWRKDIASFNYILTSSGWRQEHNGFSHQNPKFISGMLERGKVSKVYFPADGNSSLVVLKRCLKSKNGINVIVAGKTLEPRWLTIKQAEEELKEGLAIWNFASDKDPEIVFVGVGDYLTKEALAAIELLKKELGDIRIRFVNIMELSALGIGNKNTKTSQELEKYFTKDKLVIVNYHGYPSDLSHILIQQNNPKRFKVNGYIENGSTTTPFDMHVRNGTSRYDLVIDAVTVLSENKMLDKNAANQIIKEYKRKLSDHREYIKKYGVDPKEISSCKCW